MSGISSRILLFLEQHGWRVGLSACYDRKRALYSEDVIAWLKASQPVAWERLQRSNGGGVEEQVLDRLVHALEGSNRGVVGVLRRGFQIAGAGNLRMARAAPRR